MSTSQKCLRISFFYTWILLSSLLFFSSAGAESQPIEKKPINFEKIIPAFEDYVQTAMKDWNVPGVAVGIIQGDKLIYSKGFGTKEINTSQTVDAETIFPLGSTTKAFGAATLAHFVDKGLLEWNDEIVKYDRSFMLYSPWVTRNFQVIDLFAQHSGLAADSLTELIQMGFQPSYVLSKLRYLKPVTSFRSKFAYVNVLQLELEPLSQILTGKGWDTIAKENILDPLGMQRTYFKLTDFNNANNHTSCHIVSNERVKVIPLARYIDLAGPSGCMTSCIQDMAKWISMQLAKGKFQGKQIISENNLLTTWTPQTIIDASTFYALGWMNSRKITPYMIIWHGGDIEGGRSFVGFVPEANLGLVILSNLGQTMMPDAAAIRFFDLAFDNPNQDYSKLYLEQQKKLELSKKEALKAPKEPSPPLPLKNYTGIFSNEIIGDAEVSINHGKLSLKIQDKASAVLNHWDRDSFLIEWEGYLPTIEFDVGSKIIFAEDPQGLIGGFHYYPAAANLKDYHFKRRSLKN